MNPRVTVILPFFNREAVLARSIMSVLNQSYRNLELILVDDGSSDNSLAIAKSFSDERIRTVVRAENTGVASARNIGLSMAMGEYIAFQDSDDEWLTSKLETQMRFFARHANDYGAVFGDKILIGRDDNHKYGRRNICIVPNIAESEAGTISEVLIRRNVISPQTLLLKTSLLEKVGPFDNRLKNNNDWEFMLRLSQNCSIHYLNRPVVVAYISKDSISRNKVWATDSLALIADKHRALLARAPKSYASLLRRIGNGYYRERDSSRALSYHRAALSADPTQWKSWLRFGVSAAYRAARMWSGG